MSYVEVDGSKGEGGGQMLRTSVAFSAILHRPVKVTKIRAGRETPGLKRQHVSALRVLESAFGGKLEGGTEGSSAITFSPGGQGAGSLAVDMGTAASITLVLQAVIPAVALSGRRLEVELVGGTDVPWSPTFDYLDQVLRGAYRQIGIAFEARAARRGYYPRGGGKVVTKVSPCESLRPLQLLKVEATPGASLVSRSGALPRHVAERQLSAATAFLERSGIRVLAKEVSEEKSDSPGSSILIRSVDGSTFVGADALGAKGRPAEEVGRAAAERFVAEVRSGARVDVNLADMILPLLSLAPSPSKVRVREVTRHLESGLEIARQFTSCRWSVDPQGGGAIVSVLPDPGGPGLMRQNV